MDKDLFEKLTRRLRYDILRITHLAGSGHPTSSFSAVDLTAVLFFKYLRFDTGNPDSNANDRVIFSKGHASALLYSLYTAAGVLTEEELSGYRQFRSPLEGHPTNRFAYTEAATGSLGHGLSIGAGEAWTLGQIFAAEATVPAVYVLMGDGELSEGSVWEAAAWASFHKLGNLVLICDINRFGQAEETMYQYDIEVYRKRFEAFGWKTITTDGHVFEAIDSAFGQVQGHGNMPVAILAKTVKGKGIPFWENKPGWHNKMLPQEEYDKALAVFKPDADTKGSIRKPETLRQDTDFAVQSRPESQTEPVKTDTYTRDEPVATKKAFGNAIVRYGSEVPNLILLDCDVANSLHTDRFKMKYPDRFLQMYIAEQNMVGVATGLARRGMLPVVATFACFLSRAADQVRMIHLTGATVLFNGSYVGVSVGHDGPSQMGLADLAQFRALPDATVLYPADAFATEYLVREMFRLKGTVYLRTTREPTPVFYSRDDVFPVGGLKIHTPQGTSTGKRVAVVAAGITFFEALKAQRELGKMGIPVSVIDCYSVKPIDREALVKAASESLALVIAEDHYPEGGLGEAVLGALAGQAAVPVRHLAVRRTPMSGSPRELLRYAEIDAEAIMNAVKSLLQ